MVGKYPKYLPAEIESQWQKIWQKNGIYEVDLKKARKPFFNLMMFPYPSAEGLHVGNVYAFTGADIYGRLKRMQGFDVFEPIGLDGFGIHSENYALKIGEHPVKLARKTEKRFYEQLHQIGNSFAWKHSLKTYDPDYYRWTQWIFVKLYKAGLVERKKAPVNFCPSCKTSLSDEQVIAGRCERCKTEVEKKGLEQWFFKITKYADRLLKNLEWIDWSGRTKLAQKNWIGKSEGAEIKFKAQSLKFKVPVFTTRVDTIFGATFFVLSPKSEWVEKLTKPEQQKEVFAYLATVQKKTGTQRLYLQKEKTGIFTGAYVINPATSKPIPVWVADYAVGGYGTGAVMGVPAHDERDFEFAQKYHLPIKTVIQPQKPPKPSKLLSQAFEEDGILVDSSQFSGLFSAQARERITAWLTKRGLAKEQVQYRLRDWCVSRQRYWGPPIPMVDCQKCGWQPVPEKDLPVKLPYIKDYQPLRTGESPLTQAKEWFKTTCPKCGGEARRETDVSDTFFDSAWYFFRYPTAGFPVAKKFAFEPHLTKKWLPVEMYIGGHEHACLHLMYSRFLTMAFKDLGLIDFEEPFGRFYAHGLIISEGAKMSKSKGNVVIPDEYIKKFGADTLRCYLMFLGPFDQGGDFRDTGIAGMYRFLNRIWRLVLSSLPFSPSSSPNLSLVSLLQRTIKKVGEDIEALKYNTAIAAMMEFVNEWQGTVTKKQRKISVSLSKEDLQKFLFLLAPFAPFMTEELWQRLKGSKQNKKNSATFKSVHLQPWPQYNPKLIKQEKITVVVQIDGKLRDQLELTPPEAKDKKKVMVLALASPKIQKYLSRLPRPPNLPKVIFIPGKLINFVTRGG